MDNWETYIKELETQAEQVIPEDIEDDDKKYITNIIYNFCLISSEALAKEDLNDENIKLITQYIGEWTFHKSIDLIRAGIPVQLRDNVLQKIAFVVFEITKQTIEKELSKEQSALVIEHHVNTTYNESLSELKEKGSISQEDYEAAINESNVDEMSSDEENKTLKNKKSKIKKKEKAKDKKTKKSLNNNNILLWILLFTIFIDIAIRLSYVKNLYNIFFVILAIGCGFYIFHRLAEKDVEKQLEGLDAVRQKMQDLMEPNKMYKELGVDVLLLIIGGNLLAISNPDQDGDLLPKIVALRQRLTKELGYILPMVRIMDFSEIDGNEYQIAIRGNTVAKGVVYPEKYMIIADQWNKTGKPVPENAITAIDPTYQSQVYWVDKNSIDMNLDLTPIDATNVIIMHLNSCVVKYVDEIIEFSDIDKYIEFVKDKNPNLVNSLIPDKLSISDLRKIFVNLIREKVSIKDVIFIFERLCDYVKFSKDPDILSERLRAALGRQICLANTTEDNILYALSLSKEWGKILDESCQRTELGTMFLIESDKIQELIEKTKSVLTETHNKIGRQPVILCSPKIRLPLYELLERHIPKIVVISYSELITDIRVEKVATI